MKRSHTTWINGFVSALLAILLAACSSGGKSGSGPGPVVDTDGDGVEDALDAFPNDATRSVAATEVTITVGGAGTVSLPDLGADCTDTCTFMTDNAVDAMLDLSAAAAAHHQFAGWGNAAHCDDASSTCEISTGHLASVGINAVFAEDPHMLIVVDPGANGAVLERFGALHCTDYCEFKLYAPVTPSYELIGMPGPGYDFDGWTNPECGPGPNCAITFAQDTTLTLNPTFTLNPGDFDLCPGDPAAVFAGNGQDSLGATGDFVPLCNGHLILTEQALNQFIVRDVVNGVTTHTFQLASAPLDMVLVEESKLLYAAHGATTHVSRVDLRTGLVSSIFAESGAESVTASDNGALFVKGNDNQVRMFDAETGVQLGSQFLTDINIDYNDLTSRLIGNNNNYFWNPATGVLTLQGPSHGGGSGSDCNYVVVSPDGEHAAHPCGGGNGAGYSVYDFYSHDPSIVFGEWVTGAYPSGAAFAPSNRVVLLTNRFDIQVFDVATHQLIVSIPTGVCPYGDTRKLGVSSDGKLVYGITTCGFDDDSALAMWLAYDSN